MNTTRRNFLRGAAGAGIGFTLAGSDAAAQAAAAARPAAPAPAPLELLILGGTAFLGPEIVEHAQRRKHKLTLFNRGRTNPHLFPDVEKLRGDRNGDLTALAGRKWDAVIDTSGYVPRVVSAAATLLAPNAGHYVFVSTISVYADTSGARVDEETPVGKLADESVEKVTGRTYGPLKALCEQAAEKAMPGRVTNIRPGLIVGPGDTSDRFTYWPARVHRGGEILAPGDPRAEVQFVDVRDLGAWCVQVIEDATFGVFNAVGFKGRLSMQELLHGCKCVAGNNESSFTWVDESLLLERKLAPYTEVPLWLPKAHRGHIANERAVEKGLAFRPVAETIEATLAWSLKRPPEHKWRGGIAAAKETELLAAWRERSTK